MQQLALFEIEKKKVVNWNLMFEILEKKDNLYLGLLNIPSWKFIVKYSLYFGKIDTFQIIDYAWYLYLNVSLIKNIKDLIQVIIDRFYINMNSMKI